jgi:very-short-patch-repair endonuclease
MRENEKRSRPFARRLRRELTEAETILWSYLQRRASIYCVHFRRQHPIGPYVADFACVTARLIVEVDGATHCSDSELRHDRRRDAYLRRCGWRVLRVTNSDVYENLSGVLDLIDSRLAKYRKIPPPSRASRDPPPP